MTLLYVFTHNKVYYLNGYVFVFFIALVIHLFLEYECIIFR